MRDSSDHKEWVNEHLDPIQTLFSIHLNCRGRLPRFNWMFPENGNESGDTSGRRTVAVSFNSIREEHLYIHAILTGETARKNGFGSLLLQALKIRAREEFKGILLRVGDSNSNAFGWYIRRGFIPVQHESDQEQTLLRWTWNR